jgi:DNA-binding response OmpR family regulator/putative methionine-R-sulfoxide reductase with GAF domain
MFAVTPPTRARLSDGWLDVDQRTFTRDDGRQVRLTAKEAGLLGFLLAQPGCTASREQMLERVWNYAASAWTRAIDAAVARLRAKIEPVPGEPRHLLTVHGEGYQLVTGAPPEPRLSVETGPRPAVLCLGRRRIDLGTGRIQSAGPDDHKDVARAHLTPHERDVLCALARAGCRPITPHELWRAVAPGRAFRPQAITSLVHRLRSKIERDPARPEFVLTSRGNGYYLAGAAVCHQPARPLDEVLWQAARHTGEAFELDDCVIYLRDENVLVQMAAYGPKAPRPGEIQNRLTIPMGAGIVGAAAASHEVMLVADTTTDPRYIPDDYPGRSELSVPILSGNRLLGVIDSEAPRVAAFDNRHARALSSLAALLAVAISER